MNSVFEIANVLFPLLVVSRIVLFVVFKMKQKNGTLGKKKSTDAQVLLDSLIPLGMIIGCVAGILLSLFFSISLLSAISLGAVFGFLFGYFAYEFYSQKQ